MTEILLRVYLDSSDFSNLSNPSQCTEERGNVERQLIKWQEEGRIRMVFSGIHVAEAAPINISTDINSATKRFEKIHELCGTYCLKNNFYIFRKEIDVILSGEANLKETNVHSEDGDWFFSENIDFGAEVD